MSEMYYQVFLHRQFYFVLLCLAAVELGGCATATDMQLAQSHLHKPVKILVTQSPTTIDPARLQKVFAPDSKKKLTIAAQPIARGIRHSEEYTLDTMLSALHKRPDLIIVTPSAEEKPAITKLEHEHFDTAIPQQTADQIHATTGADAVLKFNLTDYGLTPTAWRSGYITFEVVSTLAITALIASAGTSLAKGAAGAYVAQETVEETAESYAGFWALDVVCRPVRIEAELVQLKPVKIVWQTTDTGLSDVSLSRLTRKVGTSERDMQLDQSTHYAVNDVINDMSEALKRLTPVAKRPSHTPLELIPRQK
jgi:hypothetical protein